MRSSNPARPNAPSPRSGWRNQPTPAPNASPSASQPPVSRQGPENPESPGRTGPLSRNIAYVAQLLRDMYSLDFRILGTASCRTEDEWKRDKLVAESDQLFQTITNILEHWETNSHWWTDEEMRVISLLQKTAKTHDPRRHRKRVIRVPKTSEIGELQGSTQLVGRQEFGEVVPQHERQAPETAVQNFTRHELESISPLVEKHELGGIERHELG